jgi:hypothetical protein
MGSVNVLVPGSEYVSQSKKQCSVPVRGSTTTMLPMVCVFGTPLVSTNGRAWLQVWPPSWVMEM